MFDLGWPEMLVIAVVLIVVVGPKDLPRMLRAFGKFTGQMRTMAGDFRKQFDEAMKEAELDEVRSTIDSARRLNPASDLKKALNPMEKAAADVRSGIEKAMKPTPKASPPTADESARPAEPAKAGAAAIPGEAKTVEAAAPTKAATATAAKPAAAKAKPAPKSGGAKPAASRPAAGKATAGKSSPGKAASRSKASS
ncbi:MAG: Sec-independent protein translocase protein TatB [Rhizobiaceae bacterium]|nr:Sec-independent protein translocase protein TatB [Rhizobiaceae bacterium]MCV0409123.1 Sec-independent protein translocase protein TatB [Rhizobiaceae bacterium]